MKDKCPICLIEWDDATDNTMYRYILCKGRCGISYIEGRRKYKKCVGKYVVYWDIECMERGWDDDVVRIYHNIREPYRGERILICGMVPYDVSEDMIRMMLVFQ